MSKGKKQSKSKQAAVSAGTIDAKLIPNTAENVKRYKNMGENLSKLNTARGNDNFFGFAFEELSAADHSVRTGKNTVVVNNNSPADIMIKHSNGKVTNVQAKVGYKNSKAGFKSNECKTALVDKGNTKLLKEAKAAGKKVIESNVTETEAKTLAKAMKLESKITGSKNSVVVSNTAAAVKAADQIHKAGIQAAGKGAAAGGGFSLGSNLVEVISGDKSVEDAAVDVIVDTAVSTGVSYGVGALGSAVASTTLGAAATSAIASTTAAAGTAITTAVGSTAAGAAALGTATTVGAAATTAAVTSAAAISTTAATVMGATLAGTAVGAAVVAAAPVVVAGAAIGVVATGISKLFGKKW